MKKFFLFIGGLFAILILIANLGPLVLLGFSIWLLYLVFKQFIKTDSTIAKILWVIVGLAILSLGLSNIYAVVGIAAAYIIYVIFKNWNNEPRVKDDDPFINFEQQWGEINK